MARIDPDSGNPVVIKSRDGEYIIPSVIYIQGGRYKAGVEAKEMFETGDVNCAVFFKRMMGEEENGKDSVCFTAEKGTPHERGYTAVELSAMLLQHLKEEAEAVVGDTISEAVITCPAYFFDKERSCIKRAAGSAGLRVQEILEEPAAAALAYGLHHWRAGVRILVYDLGGGTFDVSVVEMDDKLAMYVKGTEGLKFLGGVDFDEALQRLVLRKLTAAADIDPQFISESEHFVIRGEMESLKIKLSDHQAPRFAGVVGGQRVNVEILRSDFEHECNNLLEDTGKIIDNLLTDKLKLFPENLANKPLTDKLKLFPDVITDVLLVGGSTIMPCVREYITHTFGKPPITHANPATAVAVGAAIRTLKTKVDDIGIVREKKAQQNIPLKAESKIAVEFLGDIELRKTATHTMGIIEKSEDGTKYVNEHIISAGKPIPCKSARKFKYYPSKNSSNELEIYVLQGDRENPLECNIQNKYVVTGIRHVKKGEQEGTLIRIQYSYDKDGIIRVQARQEDDEVDLPIRKDNVPIDMSKYGKPVEKAQSGTGGSFFELRRGRAINKDVVHKYKVVTFSNVEWEKYDNISYHESGARYNEPKVHVKANEKAIEFHGYNISEMDEGVFYTISADDDFEIECNMDASTIKPHPGGNVNITLGIITAKINQNGGNMVLDGNVIANVGAIFKLRMSVTNNGHYEVYIDDILVGSKEKPGDNSIEVRFGLEHGNHDCELLSHAYISNIEMKQRKKPTSEESEADTWDD